MGYTTPNFDEMLDNPVARQIPWDDDPVLLEAWKNGRTGYPYIDAIMTQLKETGWIHHLARHSAACFLTRGDLWQSWEKGAEHFEDKLIDADWSLNNFNWQVSQSPCRFGDLQITISVLRTMFSLDFTLLDLTNSI